MHHHLALSFATWISITCSLAGGMFAIAAGLYARQHKPQAFDFAASARRIRTRPIPGRDDS
jgi:hypothetical protein